MHRTTQLMGLVAVLLGCLLGWLVVSGRRATLFAGDDKQHEASRSVLPKPEPPFRGKIARTVKDSIPDFPKEVQAPKGAPNVLLILTDDVGFGASSTFGGPCPTPTFDIGEDTGTPVADDYDDKMPFKFTGVLNRVVIELKPRP
jgi:arylsulfatase